MWTTFLTAARIIVGFNVFARAVVREKKIPFEIAVIDTNVLVSSLLSSNS
ncbi:hypothetical protein GMA14_07935 [Ruminococcus sp. zg-921]|nr:hypothetical protein [Ruminococcus sp. zg-921]